MQVLITVTLHPREEGRGGGSEHRNEEGTFTFGPEQSRAAGY